MARQPGLFVNLKPWINTTASARGGPFNGDVRSPNIILASGDRVAMDVESIKIIESFEGSKLRNNPWEYTQIRQATALGLGVKSEDEYTVITG